MLAARQPGDAVPGREAQAHVLADGTDPPGCHELARRVWRRTRGEYALAVRVVVRPEPCAVVIVRVG